jgi:NIPSNAP
MTVTCFIRYQIDPFQRAAFARYTQAWGPVAFDSMAAYEPYRATLRADDEGLANFEMAQSMRFIRREERTWLEAVDGTPSIDSEPCGCAWTPQGEQWLADLGMAPTQPSTKRRFAYPCLDWSQRRDHLAGQLADELLAHFVDKGWLRRLDGRALALTPLGQQALMPALVLAPTGLPQRPVA